MERLLVLGLLLLAFSPSSRALSLDERRESFRERIEKARLLRGSDRTGALKDLGNIAAELQPLIAENPTLAWPHLLLGRVRIYRNEPREAVSELDVAAKLGPDDQNTIFYQGYAHSMAADVSAAIPLLERAASMNAKDPRPLEELAAIYMDRREYAKARDHLKQAVELPKASTHDYGFIAEAMNAMGEYDEALPYLERATEVNPQDLNAHFNAGLAWHFKGDAVKALPHFRAVVQAEPDDAIGWAKMVQMYQAIGDHKQRDEARARVLALHKAGKTQTDDFGREQFSVAGYWVFASEVFEPAPPFNTRYRFTLCTNPRRCDEVATFNLESADVDQEYARTKETLKKGGRVYTLDKESENSHETYAFLKREPSYEEARAMVVDAINGRLKPATSTTYSGANGNTTIRR